MKVFFDTSVIVAACLEWHEHHERAFQQWKLVHSGENQGVLSVHGLLEAYAVWTRLAGGKRVSPLEAKTLLDENFRERFTRIALEPHEVDAELLRLSVMGIAGGAVYDGLHLACAMKAGAERILTFNVGYFRRVAHADWMPKIVAP